MVVVVIVVVVVVVVVSAVLVLVFPFHFIKRKPIERGWRRVRLGTSGPDFWWAGRWLGPWVALAGLINEGWRRGEALARLGLGRFGRTGLAGAVGRFGRTYY